MGKAIADKRYDYIDFLKFVACFAIISTHLFNLGIEWGTYPFSLGWVFVEFFLIITGYFTTLHFLPLLGDDNLDQRMKRSLLYTKNKFVRLLLYTTPVIFAEYVFENFHLINERGVIEYLKGFANMPFEMAYLSCATARTPRTAPVWYISATFLVFPIYCCLLQMKNRNWLMWISWIVPVLYYSYFGVSGHREYPHDLMRSFSCMMIGTWLCLSQKRLNAVFARISSRVLLTVIEVLCFAVPFLAAYANSFVMMNLCLVCFMIAVSILFSGQSYTVCIHFSFFRWISELNIPLFLWNWTIATIIQCLLPGINMDRKIFLYYAGSYLIPIVHMMIVRMLRNRTKI